MANGDYRCPSEWQEWSELLAAVLHGRNRWRLPVLLLGILFAHGRRHRDHLAPCRGHSSRLRRLLLLPGTPGTQGRLGRHATFSAFAADLAAAQTPPGSHRRHPHETLRPEGRGGRHPSQSHARPRRPEVPLRTHLGHPLAGPAASAVGRAGAALAGDALRPPKDHPQHPQETWLEVPHQAGTGRETGGMAGGTGEKGGENAVGGRRWRLYQAAVLEAGLGCRRCRCRTASQGRRPAQSASGLAAGETPRPRAERKYGENRISLAKRTGRNAAGRRSLAPSTTKRSPSFARPSWRPIVRRAG